MYNESDCGAMVEALRACLQSHVQLGKAKPCDCSQCMQIKEALAPGSGARYAYRLRDECAQIADMKAKQLRAAAEAANDLDVKVRLIESSLCVRDVAGMIRALKYTP